MSFLDQENFIIFIVILVVFMLIAIFMSLPFAIIGFFLVMLLFYLIRRDSYRDTTPTY